METIEQLLPDVKFDVPLAPYTSLKVGGPTRRLFEARSAHDIKKAVSAALKTRTPFVVLGGGTNVVVSDQGFSGLVILARNTAWRIAGTKVIAGAGVPLAVLVAQTTAQGLSGLEWAAGLPGTLGGAIFGNAGTFGKEIGDTIERVRVLEYTTGKDAMETKTYRKRDCAFDYRTSVFKRTGAVILEAVLRLEKGNAAELAEEARKNLAYRTAHHPGYQSAGCVFKNAEVRHYHKVSLADVEAEKWFDRIPSGWLIDQAGLKGTTIDGVAVSEEHGNFVLNRGGARAEYLVMLISLIKNAVHRKFGVLLEEEIRYVGF